MLRRRAFFWACFLALLLPVYVECQTSTEMAFPGEEWAPPRMSGTGLLFPKSLVDQYPGFCTRLGAVSISPTGMGHKTS